MISDEKLSAFLDAELSDEDMEAVRVALIETPSVADRLAELAQVDMVVRQAAEQATQKPLPASIVNMLSGAPSASAAATDSDNDQRLAASNVRAIGSRPKTTKKWPLPLSLAAGIAAVAGLSYMQLNSPETADNSYWANVSTVLDTAHSGDTRILESGLQVTPRLSFASHTDGYCRQADVVGKDELNVMIACKNQQGNWQLQATKTLLNTGSQAQYQTASANKALEHELDKLMSSAPLNRAQEEDAMKQQWQATKVAKGENDEN